MRTVFLCHSPADAGLARELAEFLRRGANLQIFESEGVLESPEELLRKVREGMMADAELVLLSPHSVPARWRREEWMPALWEEPQQAGVEIAFLLAAECRLPDLLRRRNFFDLTTDRLAGFRAVKAWLLRTGAAPVTGTFAPAGPAVYAERPQELETLRRRLGDQPGCGVLKGPSGSGKTALALAFAALAAGDFEGVFWVSCGARSAAGAAGDLAEQMGLRLPGPVGENLVRLRRFAADRRFLIVLDDLESPAHLDLAPGGWSSTLITTRLAESPACVGFELMLGERRAGPGATGLSEAERRLLEAVAACAPGCSLGLAAQVAELEDAEAGRLAESLLRREALLKLEDPPPRFDMPAGLRERMRTQESGRSHAECVSRHPDAPLAEIERALEWTLRWEAPEAWPLACALARLACRRAKAAGRTAEAYEAMRAAYRAAGERGDLRSLCEFAWELYWITLGWGWDEDAWKYHLQARTEDCGQMALPF